MNPVNFPVATASGTLPQNLFLGAQGAHGSYDQCLAAKRVNDEGEIDLVGQYCTLHIHPTQKMFEDLKKFMEDDPFFKVSDTYRSNHTQSDIGISLYGEKKYHFRGRGRTL